MSLKEDLMKAMDPCCMGAQPWADLRARLARAAIAEPERIPPDRCQNCGGPLPQPPEPTDTDLRAQLQAALPAGWAVDGTIEQEPRVWVQHGDRHTSFVQYSALRAPGGVERCAAALRVLAGEQR